MKQGATLEYSRTNPSARTFDRRQPGVNAQGNPSVYTPRIDGAFVGFAKKVTAVEIAEARQRITGHQYHPSIAWQQKTGRISTPKKSI